MPVDRILGFDAQMIYEMCFQFLNTAILCGFLTYLLYKPVKKFMANRTDKINNQIVNAQTKLSEAEVLKRDYESKMANIELERNEILETARKRAAEREQQIITSAEKEAENLKNRSLLEIQRELDKSREEMKQQMIEIASLLASKYVETALDEPMQNKLLNEVISDLGEVKWLS